MRATTAAFAIAAAATTVSAQTQNYTSSLNMTLPNPGAIDDQLRASWCTAQHNTCDVLCTLNTADNDCIVETLEYECTCSSNSSAPGLQFYSQTIPFFVCQRLADDCIANSGGDLDVERACQSDIGSHCLEHAPPTVEEVREAQNQEESTSTSSAPSGTATEASESSGTSAPETTAPSDNDGDNAGIINVPGSGAVAVAALGLLAALL